MQKHTPAASDEEKLLQRRVSDAVKATSADGRPHYLGFFNLRERQLATEQLNRLQVQKTLYDGGFESAERVMLCVFEDLEDVRFPIAFCAITPRDGTGLTHRDYLGALLGTGIQRSCLGDIRSDEEGAIVAVQTGMLEYICQNLREVGHSPVAVQPVDAPDETDAGGVGELRTASVASLRLDAVLAAMLHMSRGDAASLVRQGRVQVNHLLSESLHFEVEAGDVLSIRGVGKYRLDAIGGKSRKQRTFIEFVQYT